MTDTQEEKIKPDGSDVAALLASLSEGPKISRPSAKHEPESSIATTTMSSPMLKNDHIPLLKPPKKRTGEDAEKARQHFEKSGDSETTRSNEENGHSSNLKRENQSEEFEHEEGNSDEDYEEAEDEFDRDFEPDEEKFRALLDADKQNRMETGEDPVDSAPIPTNNSEEVLINGEVGEKRKRGGDDDWKPGVINGKKKLKNSPTEKMPKIIKKPSEGRLSFQEAAVRVLIEQRTRGVYALSTRKIWELIMQSGLVDTKCKTPVSSLSSRITEDVRTKGNKSVFVRVGEGLYTLRKGMKKQDLEKFLTTKYPHLTREIPEDAVDDDEDDEEEIKMEVEEKPEVSTPLSFEEPMVIEKELKEESPMKSEPTPEEPKWIGLPLKTKANGDIYYSAVKTGGKLFRVGDCSHFTPNSEDQNPYVGQITKFWQSASPALKDKSASERMFVQCIWYYIPEDTPAGRTKKHHKREIFFSDLSDVNTVDSLISPVEVVSFDEFNKKLPHYGKKDLKKLYFCRSFYSDNTKEVHPLRVDQNNHVEIEGLQDERAIPKNWPNTVQYTANTLWRVPEQFREYFQKKYNPNVEIRVIEDSAKSRLSLFATSNISEGTILGEYTGIISISPPSREGMEEEPSSLPKQPRFLHNLFEDEEVRVQMDGNISGNEFRFISPATANEKANVKFVPIWLAGKWHLVIVSKTNIQKEDELFSDFGNIKGKMETEPIEVAPTVTVTSQVPTAIQTNTSPSQAPPTLPTPQQ